MIVITVFDEITTRESQTFYQIEMHEGPQQVYWYTIFSVVRTPIPETNQMKQVKTVLEVSDLYAEPSDCWNEGKTKYDMIVSEARGRAASDSGVH